MMPVWKMLLIFMAGIIAMVIFIDVSAHLVILADKNLWGDK